MIMTFMSPLPHTKIANRGLTDRCGGRRGIGPRRASCGVCEASDQAGAPGGREHLRRASDPAAAAIRQDGIRAWAEFAISSGASVRPSSQIGGKPRPRRHAHQPALKCRVQDPITNLNHRRAAIPCPWRGTYASPTASQSCPQPRSRCL
jgi:hypothetical protein